MKDSRYKYVNTKVPDSDTFKLFQLRLDSSSRLDQLKLTVFKNNTDTVQDHTFCKNTSRISSDEDHLSCITLTKAFCTTLQSDSYVKNLMNKDLISIGAVKKISAKELQACKSTLSEAETILHRLQEETYKDLSKKRSQEISTYVNSNVKTRINTKKANQTKEGIIAAATTLNLTELNTIFSNCENYFPSPYANEETIEIKSPK